MRKNKKIDVEIEACRLVDKLEESLRNKMTFSSKEDIFNMREILIVESFLSSLCNNSVN